MNRKDLYKARRIPKLAESLAKRCQNVASDRHEKQRDYFWTKRGQADSLPSGKSESLEKKKNMRAEMFKKWKMEKLRKLEEEKQKKKPVFKVGIVQRTATGSPLKISNNARKQVRGIENNQLLCQGNLTKENTEGIITRSKTKAKAGMSENHLKCQEGITKQLLSTNTNVKLKNEFCKIDSGKAKSLDSYKFNPPKSVTQLPLSSKLTYPNSSNLSNKRKKNLPLVKRNPCEPDEINLNVSKDKFTSVKVTPQELKNDLNQDLDDFRSPAKKVAFQKENVQIINYSPFMSRRKNESKISSCASSDKNLTKEKNEFQYKISLFRRYIENESKMLLDKCETWKHIYEEFPEIPEDIEGEIDSLIGKTQLLTSDKFMQFKSLIDKCEAGDPLIKIEDLQGFQDWISIEVERIDNDFCKLEKRKQNNWVAEIIEIKKSKATKIKMNKKSSKKIIGKSDIRSHINALRKERKNQEITVSPNSSDLSNKLPLKASENLGNDVLNLEMMPTGNLKRTIALQRYKFLSPSENLLSAVDESITIKKSQTPDQSIIKKKSCTLSSLKTPIIFEKNSENIRSRTKGLNEKYFRPPSEDKNTPSRFVLRDLNLNTTPSKIITRSQVTQ